MATPATERQCFGEESLSRPLLPLSIRRSLGSRLRQLRFARYGGDAATRLLISTFPLLSVTNSALSTILAAQQEHLRPPLHTAAQLPQTEIGRHKQKKCVNDLSDLRR